MANTEIREPIKGKMPIKSHLVELRDRILKCVIVLVIAVCISFVFTTNILEFLKVPAGNAEFQSISLTENMSVWFKVALTSAVIIAMPYLVYQLFAFVAPGLTSKEKKLIFKLLPFITVMFLAGVAFAYYVALPPALSFLNDFLTDISPTVWQLSDYINIVTRMLLVIGCIFETPVIVMVLARMGIVSPQWLASKRKIWFVLAFVLSALITPTMDPINQSIVAAPLIILLELSIFLSRFVYKKKNTVPVTEAQPKTSSKTR